MRQLNLTMTAGVVDLWVAAYDDAKRNVPIAAVRLDRWVLQIDDGDPSSGGLNVRLRAAGYQEWQGRMPMPADGTQIEAGVLVELEPSAANFPPGRPRAPWGPPVTCGSCPSPDSYDKTLPFEPPLAASLEFMRANAWSVECRPGLLPFVPGGSSEHPERLITAFLYKYDPSTWRDIFQTYADAGYTHWVLWWPNARADGMSRDDFIAMCHVIQAAGFYTNIGLVSKDLDPHDQSVPEWANYLDGDYVAFLLAHAGDEYAVWEWDLFNVPGTPTLQILSHWGAMAHAHGKSFWLHFRPGYCSWQADNRGEAGFWEDLGTQVDGLHYQGVPTWDVGEMQSRIVDIYRLFNSQGNRVTLRPFEWKAELQFTHDNPTELESDQLGYLALCTRGDAIPSGYGFGARRPNGAHV